MNEKILERCSVKIVKLILIFISITEKKKKIDGNGYKYILLRIDVYFTEYLLLLEIDEKGHTDRDLIFEKKRKKALEKNFVVNLSELIRVKKVKMQAMKHVEYKHLSGYLKTNN